MYFSVRDYLTPYSGITTLLPNYAINSTTFFNALIQIQQYSELQKFSKEGITDNKNILKDLLIVLAGDSARKLKAFAKFTNNPVLLKEVCFSESKMKQVANTDVKDYAQIVYDRAQPLLASLSTYGINATTQTALLNAITAYNASIGKPRVGKVEITQATIQIAEYFKLAQSALENIDASVEIVRLTQPNFYNGYKANRRIIDNGTKKIAVNLFVSDSNGHPIKDAKALFILQGEGLKVKPIEKKTAIKGGLHIRNMQEGEYSVKISKLGYEDKLLTLFITNGETTFEEVVLEK